MFDKEGVVSKTNKQSKMFQSPSHDKMTTGNYNKAGTDHGVGISPRIGSATVSKREIVPIKSKAWVCKEFDE